MNLEIDIEGGPPSQEEIDACRENFRKEIERTERISRRNRNKRLLLAVVITTGICLLFNSLFEEFIAFLPPQLMFIGLLGFMGTLILSLEHFLTDRNLENQSILERMNRALKSLDTVERKYRPEIVSWCRNDPIVATYQAAVSFQNRPLINEEHHAMKIWIESTENRKTTKARDTEELRSAEILKTPTREGTE